MIHVHSDTCYTTLNCNYTSFKGETPRNKFMCTAARRYFQENICKYEERDSSLNFEKSKIHHEIY